MYKKSVALFTAALLLAGLAAMSFAAGPSGRVVAVEGDVVKVKVAVESGNEAWLKKGAAVKLKGGKGKVVAVEGDSVLIRCDRAGDLKAGDTVTIDRGAAAALQGC